MRSRIVDNRGVSWARCGAITCLVGALTPWLPFYAYFEDMSRLESFLNQSSDVAMIQSVTAGKWRACRPVHLQTGRNCLWYVPSVPLPLVPATYDDDLGVVDDPWAWWTELRQGADPKRPFFGLGHPGIIWPNMHERSEVQPEAIAISSIEWSGARHSNGSDAELTRRFWASLLRWMNRQATKIPRSGGLDGGTAEIYALNSALAEIQARTPRSTNPTPFEHVT